MNTEKKIPSVATIKQRLDNSRQKTAELEETLKKAAAAATLSAAPKIEKLRSRQWVYRGRYYWEKILTPEQRADYDIKVREWLQPRNKMVMTLAIEATEAAAAKKAAKNKNKKTATAALEENCAVPTQNV